MHHAAAVVAVQGEDVQLPVVGAQRKRRVPDVHQTGRRKYRRVDGHLPQLRAPGERIARHTALAGSHAYFSTVQPVLPTLAPCPASQPTMPPRAVPTTTTFSTTAGVEKRGLTRCVDHRGCSGPDPLRGSAANVPPSVATYTASSDASRGEANTAPSASQRATKWPSVASKHTTARAWVPTQTVLRASSTAGDDLIWSSAGEMRSKATKRAAVSSEGATCGPSCLSTCTVVAPHCRTRNCVERIQSTVVTAYVPACPSASSSTVNMPQFPVLVTLATPTNEYGVAIRADGRAGLDAVRQLAHPAHPTGAKVDGIEAVRMAANVDRPVDKNLN